MKDKVEWGFSENGTYAYIASMKDTAALGLHNVSSELKDLAI